MGHVTYTSKQQRLTTKNVLSADNCSHLHLRFLPAFVRKYNAGLSFALFFALFFVLVVLVLLGDTLIKLQWQDTKLQWQDTKLQ
jgi:hypothetical protein